MFLVSAEELMREMGHTIIRLRLQLRAGAQQSVFHLHPARARRGASLRGQRDKRVAAKSSAGCCCAARRCPAPWSRVMNRPFFADSHDVTVVQVAGLFSSARASLSSAPPPEQCRTLRRLRRARLEIFIVGLRSSPLRIGSGAAQEHWAMSILNRALEPLGPSEPPHIALDDALCSR
jgi:hypothetical protein